MSKRHKDKSGKKKPYLPKAEAMQGDKTFQCILYRMGTEGRIFSLWL